MASNETTHGTQSSAITKASAPFDHPDADVILRSSDNVDFRTFKLLLSLASPVFKTMFGLPQNQGGEGDEEEMQDGLPVVSMSEDSIAVERLLAYCHPVSTAVDVVGGKLMDISIALEVTSKYDMEGAKRGAQAALISSRFLETEPLRVYAIACRFKLKDEAKIAAKYMLRIEAIPSYVAELEYVTGGDLLRLQKYHQACGKAASGLLEYSWIMRVDYTWFANAFNHCAANEGSSRLQVQGIWVCPRSWWMEYMRDTSAALKHRPCGTTVLQSDIMNTALRRACACDKCREQAFEHMEDFSRLYAEEVEKVTSKIELELKF